MSGGADLGTPGPGQGPADGPARRVLVAGLGNIFLGDDGFGVEAVQRLARRPLPPGAETADIGVRGVHLAYQLLDGYDTAVLIDATARGGVPGTVYRIDGAEADPADGDVLIDGHRMTPDAVLALLDTLSAGTGGSRPGRVVVIGCEPAVLEEGIGLSPAVADAVGRAVEAVLDLLREECGDGPGGPREKAPAGADDARR
ncbi:hydrogenase maturation protease [Actinacidiphila rubida]|uniref:Hydrogenase maturation protease n=1 Tax=Actinacidiphila rubida TaxID=310780 RepID=A0A1H8SRC5_9ACTN|nr:hydrogenase maturation protease [Actinacidiphila rubida]SEO81330.1 hydrogenase maturation protease [Actinacidiphila rubida]